MNGYFGIGIYQAKNSLNIGGLWRSASLYDAAFVFTIGARYRRQPSDTPKTPHRIPLFAYDTLEDFYRHLPHGAPLVGVELDEAATALTGFDHPARAVYLLGAEDNGLPQAVRDRCLHLVQIEAPRPESMNVASAGAVLLHHRHIATSRRGLSPLPPVG